MLQVHPCPKCGRQLRANGEITIDGKRLPLPVFQCDECISVWEFGGEKIDTALTFLVDDRGRVLNSETLEPLDLAAIHKREK